MVWLCSFCVGNFIIFRDFSSSDGVLRALDFNVLNGSFGQIPTDKAMSFRGAGGSGAKDGFYLL